MPPTPFHGLHCAVVGATGLIGSRIATAFASRGAAVTLLGRSALEARSRLEPDLPPPGPHRFIRLNVAEPDDIKAVFGPPVSSCHSNVVGPLDILVNCAGISQTTLLRRTPDDELAAILDTNLLATMLVCKHARIRPNGCIINVSSLMANKGGYGATAYAASKAGLIAFTRALCFEMAARSIRVNALLPGWVDSPMWHQLKPELKEAYLKGIPLNRVADPEEVADAAVFLASNRFANNCVLNLDGGMSAA
ncbi:3-ketoacyl-(acyl-carrier-protein) reductase [Ophiocordyceps camponoti-floridani]|uniref:3-ketoacyl-(Acyl-carrier-protein) reductase n=1 Tax=Ophiocordyceps camponoti-floridani TaxID=2030778 RepID=A0A8H4Q3X1_9HYPO|nr:3-ketoacyl-(acyl-carrier-protein) reductase [Ophiocordyceps camponoti-floridani]